MKVLFVGGTGNISRYCVREAAARGMEVHLFHRGRSAEQLPDGVHEIHGDIRDVDEAERLLSGKHFDAVADFIAFTPEHIDTAFRLFRDRTAQYLFISSASAYHKPPSHYLITESTPLYNPYWQYSRDKIACEARLRQLYVEADFPFTVVRPSHTYGEGWIPTSFGSRSFTVPSRMLEGKEVVVHGDGQSLWTLTHGEDFARAFVGLLGNHRAVGESFHITSDEALSWDQIHATIAHALGVRANLVHIPSEVIAALRPARAGGLLGDKMYSVVFDNGKIKRFVPGFTARIPFHEGVRRSLAWFDERPERKAPDDDETDEIESILGAWKRLGISSLHTNGV